MARKKDDMSDMPETKTDDAARQTSEDESTFTSQISLLDKASKACLHILYVSGALMMVLIALYMHFETDPSHIVPVLEASLAIIAILAVSSTLYIDILVAKLLIRKSSKQ